MANPLSMIVLRTSQMDATLALYGALGLSFTKEQHGAGPVHFSCDLDGTLLEVYPGNEGTPPNRLASGATSLGFRVSSVEATLANLKNLGASVITPPKESQWGVRAVIADHDGRSVELLQTKQ